MSHHDEHDTHGGHHVTPLWIYNTIFAALLVLTVITVAIAQVNFGPMNTVIAMLVATVKASLVALFFMHLLHDERLNLLTFGFGLLFVCLFFLFPLVDIGTRTYIDPLKDNNSVTKIGEIQDAQETHAADPRYKDLRGAHPRGFLTVAEDEKVAPPAPVALEGSDAEGATQE
jgi:cytochrome c oxidase subunit 4